MNSSIQAPEAPTPSVVFSATVARRLESWARKFLLSRLNRLKRGRIVIKEGAESLSLGSAGKEGGLRAAITVHSSRFYPSVLFGGSIGAGEAYMAGDWTCEDLTGLIRIILQNQDLFLGLDRGWARLTAPLHKVFHFLNRNTPQGSRRNITAHYDLGNDFYSLFLDETLTYSCGIFESPESTLGDASRAKYDRICRKLSLGPEDRVIEIGTGWGGFAIHAASQCGCRVTTTTISPRQHELARKRVQEAGLGDRVEVLLQDYRALRGKFDKLVSIEMIEAVGHQFLDTFFRCCSDLLKEDGMMALQAITMPDQAYDRHKRSVDFIKRYIFPGSCTPSVEAISRAVAEVTNLRIFHLEDITPHYARTLRTWRERFFAHLPEVRALGFSDSFIRMWEFYLCSCEASFAERYNGDVQMIFIKPLCRKDPILPRLG
jgi:cyclopropane-fatty-acyl-phospholipid synthase